MPGTVLTLVTQQGSHAVHIQTRKANKFLQFRVMEERALRKFCGVREKRSGSIEIFETKTIVSPTKAQRRQIWEDRGS